MKIINYQETEKMLLQKMDAHNHALPRSIDTNGRNYISASAKPLRGCHINTMMAVIHILCKHQFVASKLKIENRRQFIETHNPQLSAKTGYSRRTIERHIERLVAVGFISEKINKPPRVNGLKNGKVTSWKYQPFELITPETSIVFAQKLSPGEGEINPDMVMQQELEKEILHSESATDCRHSHTKKIKKIREKAAFSETGKHLIVFTEKTKSKSNGAPTEMGKVSGAPQLAYILSLAQILWDYSRARLYAHWQTVAPSEQTAAIKFFVEILKPATTERALQKYFNEYLWRIELRHQWQLKKPEREKWIVQPSKYFNLQNENGFILTKQWYVAIPPEKLKAMPDAAATFNASREKIFNSKVAEYVKQPDLKKFLQTLSYFQRHQDSYNAKRFVVMMQQNKRDNETFVIQELLRKKFANV